MNTINFKVLRFFAAAVGALSLCFAVQNALADTVLDYTLQGVKFSDGAIATGTFDWDATTATIDGYDITTSGGSALPGFTYTSGTAFSDQGTFGANPADSFLLQSSAGIQYLSFVFDGALTAGGVDDITITGGVSPGSYECNNCSIVRSITAGDAAAANVPEPLSIALFAIGLFAAFAIHRRNRSV